MIDRTIQERVSAFLKFVAGDLAAGARRID